MNGFILLPIGFYNMIAYSFARRGSVREVIENIIQERFDDFNSLLTKFRQSNLIEQAEIDRLKQFEKTTLPLLAESLPDRDLGHYAELVMQQVDSIGATPYLLKVLPQSDGIRQHEVSAAANRGMEQYEWHVRAGAPKPNPAKPPPRYSRNTEPYPYRRELHDAAVACLRGGLTEQKGAEREALLTVGATGNRREVPGRGPLGGAV
jgi:hypothetical protein